MTATLHHNTRDTKTLSPKVLLTDILNDDGTVFRNHCWIPITTAIEAHIPKTNLKKVHLSFTANVKPYRTYGPEKYTLHKIRNITVA